MANVYDPHEKKKTGLLKYTPSDFYVIKADVEALGSPRTLVNSCVTISIVVGIAFVVLVCYFYLLDTSTDTVISGTLLDGYNCTMISPINSRVVTYTCHNPSSVTTPVPCALASGFGGYFFDLDDGSLYSGSSIQIEYEASIFYPTYQNCLDSFSSICTSPPYKPTLTTYADDNAWAFVVDGFNDTTAAPPFTYLSDPLVATDSLRSVVFLAESGGIFHALNSTSGSGLWRAAYNHTAYAAFSFPPSVAYLTLSLPGSLYQTLAYNASTGALLFTSPNCSLAPTVLSSFSGHILCITATATPRLEVYDPLAASPSTPLYSQAFAAGVSVPPLPSASGSLIYVLDNSPTLYAITTSPSTSAYAVAWTSAGYPSDTTLTPLTAFNYSPLLVDPILDTVTTLYTVSSSPSDLQILCLTNQGYLSYTASLPGAGAFFGSATATNGSLSLIAKNATAPYLYVLQHDALVWTTALPASTVPYTTAMTCDGYLAVRPASVSQYSQSTASLYDIQNFFQYTTLGPFSSLFISCIQPSSPLYFQTDNTPQLAVFGLDAQGYFVVEWVTKFPPRITSANLVAVSGSTLYLATNVNFQTLILDTMPTYLTSSLYLGVDQQSAVVFDATNTMYFGNSDGKLYSVFPDGSEQWETLPDNMELQNSLAVGINNTVYYAYSSLFLFNASSGARLVSPIACDYNGSTCDCFQPIVDDQGYVYLTLIGCGPSVVAVLVKYTSGGQLIWSFELPDGVYPNSPAQPQIFSAVQRAYIAGVNNFYILDSLSGHAVATLRFSVQQFAASNQSGSCFLLSDAYTSTKPTIYAYSAAGSPLWTLSLPGSIAADSVLFVLLPNGLLYLQTSSGLYAVDSDTGSQEWAWTTDMDLSNNTATLQDSWALIDSSSTSSSGVFFSYANKSLSLIDEYGLLRWTLSAPAATTGSCLPPVFFASDSTILFCCDAAMYAVDPWTGVILWSNLLDSAINQLAVDNDGTVYVFSSNILIMPLPYLTTLLYPNDCLYSSAASNTISFSSALRLLGADASSQAACGPIFNQAYCQAGSNVFEYLATQFCADYQFHPPYSCSRTVNQSFLAALSLAFSFANLVYSVLITVCTWLLWRSFEKSQAGKGGAGAGAKNGKAGNAYAANPLQKVTYSANGPAAAAADDFVEDFGFDRDDGDSTKTTTTVINDGGYVRTGRA